MLWANDTPVIDVIDDAEIDKPAGVDIYQWLREVCTTKLMQSPSILGGLEIIAQVDESLFHHKPKASFPHLSPQKLSYICRIIEEYKKLLQQG